MRLIGEVGGGGRLSVGNRWPDGFFMPTELIVQAGGRCVVDGNFDILTGCSVIVGPGSQLTLGSGFMNNGASIACFQSITIGADAAIGPDVSIRDSDSHFISGAGENTMPIVIGDHVWIGARVIILKGVRIGDGAVIAAGAIVTRDVEPNMLVAGSPARPIRHVTWTHERPADPAQAPSLGGGLQAGT
jgi:acetyltransferase-like isoleucine patch superfamily enzyme